MDDSMPDSPNQSPTTPAAPNPVGSVTVPPMPLATPTPPLGDAQQATPSISEPSAPASGYEPAGGGKAKKLGLLLLGIIVIGGLAVGGYYLGVNKILNPAPESTPTPEATVEPTPTATPDPTADWRTYKDDAYLFSFKYPDNWEVNDLLPANKELASHKNDLVFLGLAPKGVREDILGSIVVRKGDVIDSAKKEVKTIPEGSANTVISEKNTSLNGNQAVEITVGDKDGNVIEKIYVLYDSVNTFVIRGGGSDDNEIPFMILSTFQVSPPENRETPNTKD